MTEEPIAAAWSRVLDNWGDPEAHRKFIALARSMDALAEAGARYREVRETDPARSEVAAAQISKLIAAAVSTLEPLRTPERKRPPIALYVVAALMALALVAGVYYALESLPSR
jgi:hypothetical protein